MALKPRPSAAVRRLAAFFLPAVLSATVHAASDPNAFLKDGERQLEEGRTLFDGATLNAARNAFTQCVQADQKNVVCLTGLARTEFYLSKIEEIAGHADASHKMLDIAVGDAQKAVALNDQSAAAHALLADLYGAKITGMLSGMKYGPKANTESQRALQLDPNNAFVYAVLGRKYFYSPSAFGGDINKAIDSFRHAAALDPNSDEALVWLAKAYKKKGDPAHAEEALAQALRLNPRSVFAQRVQAGKE
jgi:tetratricopeptide (TPR) repeat protein